MKKPAWRTVAVILSLALMGGLVCISVKGNFADYAALLKALGWAVGVKASLEHGANIFTKPAPSAEPK